MSRSERRYASWAIAGAACAAVACAALVPLDRRASPAPTTSLDPCGPLPERPDAASTTSVPSMLFAVSELSLEGPPGATACPQHGFDLDGLDTRPPTPCIENRACAARPPPVGFETRIDTCDRPSGVDDSIGKLIALILSLPGGREMLGPDPSVALAKGIINWLVQVNGYNGEDDDDEVTVGFLAASTMEGVPLDIPLTYAVFEMLPMVWDGGSDAAWVVDTRTIVKDGPIARPRFEAAGYVRGRVLVVPSTGPGHFPLVFQGFPYRAGVFSAKIEPPSGGAGYRLTHVRFGMRIVTAELLKAFAAAPPPTGDGGPACLGGSGLAYEVVVKPGFCAGSDLPGVGKSKDAPCEEISLATVELTMVQTRFSAGFDGVAVGLRGGTAFEVCIDRDAGTEWCDHCDWDASRRCPLDAGVD